MTLEQEIQLGSVALDAIGKIIEAVRSAKAGKLDPTVALAGIQALHDALVENNATIDAEAHQKFDTSST